MRSTWFKKKVSGRQEKLAAKDIGGKTLPASGALKFGGGADVLAEYYMIECKYTEESFYYLKADILNKVEIAAKKILKTPVLEVSFVSGGHFTSYAIIPPIFKSDLIPITTTSTKLELDELKHLFLKTDILLLSIGKKKYQIMNWKDFIERVKND